MSVTVPLNVALSVVHDRLLCPFDQYRAFLNVMTGQQLALWDIARARRAVARKLDDIVPELAVHRPPDKTDSGNANKYVKGVAKKVGYEEVVLTGIRPVVYKTRTASKALT